MENRRLDLDRYLSIPRLAELDLSPDGRWLAFTAARLARDGKKFVRDLWRVATDGRSEPERLSVGESSDSSPRWLDDGSLLFLSARRDPEGDAGAEQGVEPLPQIWILPPAGEARCLSHRPGGIEAFVVSRATRALLFRAETNPGALTLDAERAAEESRKKAGASGLLYDQIPIRFWDRFYGPRYAHLFHAPDLERIDEAHDLSPDATLEHDDLGFDISPDGSRAVASERARDAQGRFYENLRLFHLGPGGSRWLTTGQQSYSQPRISPDGKSVVAVFHELVEGKTGRQWLVDVAMDASSPPRPLTQDLDLWPESPIWSPDGQSIFFVADQLGQHLPFEVSNRGDKLVRLARRGSFSDLAPSHDGARLHAIASTYDRPPEIVSLATAAADQIAETHSSLAARAVEGLAFAAPEALRARAKDGREIHSWLLRPTTPAPEKGHPLILWVHGGPLGAWSDGWHWRWNPQLFTARGWAVLLVNPRISTGFGQAFIEEGFARWGAEPYEDLMAAVEQAATVPGIDGSRVAAMGGSFGGYMANWIAGHSSRFRCIVSHAGLWHLTGFHGTTDHGPEWEREFGGDPYRHPETYERWSPHRFVKDIRTPMLVVHGEKDYRVPVAEAFQLFTALQRLGVASRLLYFPDENHWILRPPNVRSWHDTIFNWLERWL